MRDGVEEILQVGQCVSEVKHLGALTAQEGLDVFVEQKDPVLKAVLNGVRRMEREGS